MFAQIGGLPVPMHGRLTAGQAEDGGMFFNVSQADRVTYGLLPTGTGTPTQGGVLKMAQLQVSHKSVLQECSTRVSCKSVSQECPARVSHKSVP